MLLHCLQSALASDTFEDISADSGAAVVLGTLVCICRMRSSIAMPGYYLVIKKGSAEWLLCYSEDLCIRV